MKWWGTRVGGSRARHVRDGPAPALGISKGIQILLRMSWPDMAHTVARAVIVSIFRSSTTVVALLSRHCLHHRFFSIFVKWPITQTSGLLFPGSFSYRALSHRVGRRRCGSVRREGVHFHFSTPFAEVHFPSPSKRV